MNIVVFGASGAIGSEFTLQLSKKYPSAKVFAFSRDIPKRDIGNIHFDSLDCICEKALVNAASSIKGDIDMLIVATGKLHGEAIMPERSISEISLEKFQILFQVNSVIPMLIAKAFISKFSRSCIFAIMSARIGSISDNHLGGWYSYRASKAALNMLIKTLSIELARKNKDAIVIGLHPGTVDSALSKPFQANIPDENVFSPQKSVSDLIGVLEKLTPRDSGMCYAWDGKKIDP